FTRLAFSNGFKVVAGAAILVSPTNATANSTLTVTWAGIAAPTSTDWVALVPLDAPNGSYVAWGFTTGAASGTLDLFVPASVPNGAYELRLFSNNTFNRLAVSNVIHIGS